ncbi:MAG: hypothetical protein ACI8PV_002019 [Dinoroseobacter sp.]
MHEITGYVQANCMLNRKYNETTLFRTNPRGWYGLILS